MACACPSCKKKSVWRRNRSRNRPASQSLVLRSQATVLKPYGDVLRRIGWAQADEMLAAGVAVELIDPGNGQRWGVQVYKPVRGGASKPSPLSITPSEMFAYAAREKSETAGLGEEQRQARAELGLTRCDASERLEAKVEAFRPKWRA